MAIPVIETERLLLQPLVLDDAEQYQQQFPVWEVVRLLPAFALGRILKVVRIISSKI